MSMRPTSQEEWTVHALNIHGAFFERRCAELIEGIPNWQVLARNHPVEYPPPNGPYRGKDSSVDLWARRRVSEFHLDVMIECKKANPEFVNWVFFPKTGAVEASPFTFVVSKNSLNETGSAEAWKNELALQTGSTESIVADDAREVRCNYSQVQGNNKTKTSNAAIGEAAYQIALGSRAIVSDDSALLRVVRESGKHPHPPWAVRYYIPIIVTTARLFVARFDVGGVALDTGEIALNGVTFDPVKSVVYEYPLPKHLQHAPQDRLAALNFGISSIFTRMHIPVVHSENLEEFLQSLFASERIAQQWSQADDPASGGPAA